MNITDKLAEPLTGDGKRQGRTPFGLKSGRVCTPSDVVSGLACGCLCPECGASLIAKKGAKTAWHFAHHNVVAKRSCLESAIHAAAKQVLLEERWLQLPEKRIAVSGRTKSGALHMKSAVLSRSRPVRFEFCREEVAEAKIRPDVVGYRGNRRLLVEMFFTNQVNESKRQSLEDLGLPAIEINLSTLDWDSDFECIRQRVLHDVAEKEWLYYPGEKEQAAALLIELNEELQKLNLEHDMKVAASERKAEDRRQQEERTRRAVMQAHEQYRALSTVEKERRLREELGMTGSWPYYLNKENPHCSAITEQPRLWQAAVFARFIFGRRLLGRPLEVDVVVEWVGARFGVADGRAKDVRTAVRLFLGYLSACGFLRKSPYNPYEETSYEVVHDVLKPPALPRKPDIEVETMRPQPKPVVRANPSKVPMWLWRASWPRKAEIREAAERYLLDSPHRELLLKSIEVLTPSGRPGEPFEYAQQLEAAYGIPSSVTLDLLVGLELVLKGARYG